MRNFSLFVIGSILLLSYVASAQTPKIRIGYVENTNGQYNECGKRLAFNGSKENRYIFVYANDITEMNIDGKVVNLTLESSTERTEGTTDEGQAFEEKFSAGTMKVTIKYIVKGYSDNTVWYKGKLTVAIGRSRRSVYIKGNSGC